MTCIYRPLLLFIFSCGSLFVTGQTAPPKNFTTLPASYTGVDFRNDIQETASMFLYIYEYLYIGAGVTVGDVDNDGLPDLYFSSTQGSNKLYKNLGNLQFRDVTESAGVGGGNGIKTGVNMIDINNDGYLDIFICKSGYKDPALRKKIFYINNKNGTFTDRAKEYGLDDASYTTQSYFFDYDNDGDKDVFFINHPIDFSKSMTIPATIINGKMVYAEDTATVYVSDRLFENRNGKFIDVTKKAGLISHAFGLSVSVADINRDGWLDLYVANDFSKPDFLYINNRNGTFSDKLSSYIGHVSFSAMGSDVSDLNNDGHEDIYVMDMAVEEPVRQKQLFALNQNYDKFRMLLQYNLYYQYPRNTLQLNNGNGTYSEIGHFAGVAETDWSWSPLVADYDNDGWKDIYVTNGLKRDMTDWDYKVFVLDSIMNAMNRGKSVDMNSWLQSMPSVPVKNYFYRNNKSLRFDNATAAWSDEPASFSNGAAYADLDNDGDLDLVVNNIDAPAFILKNNTAGKENSNYLRFKFYRSPASPEEIYGATVSLTDKNGITQYQHYNPQRGFLSTSEHALHFGVGDQETIAKAEIIFPGRKKIVLENIKTNNVVTVYASDALASGAELPVKKEPAMFTDVSASGKLKYRQVENEFIDFKREPLIPYQCSRKGPYFAKANVSSNTAEDIYIGGAAGVEGKLMTQNATGNFTQKPMPAFTADKQFEDMGSIFFDADGDGDQDLYVVSGGAQFEKGSALYRDRLYYNDGKGNFARAIKALPEETSNGSCVTSLDYDGDGDLDLFVGGHVLPGVFPKPDRSMLLQNNKGVFTEVTATISPALQYAGIVNSAVWADMDGDGKKELSISGEWMPLQIYEYSNGKFEKRETMVSVQLPSKRDSLISMNDLTGWWYDMEVTDLNGDGKLDYVMANRGLNSVIKGNINEPCKVYAKDIDGNGSYDAVLGFYIQGKCYPLFSRDQLIDQVPSMRKKFVRYRQYSGKTIDEIFTPAEKSGMDIYKTNFFESGVLLNEGNNRFRFVPFPDKAQFSNINDVVTDDLDGDGITDILLCGNSKDPSVMVGVYDATSALMLKGKGDGSFTAVPPADNGLKVAGESRRIIFLKNASGTNIIFLKNSDAAQVFRK